MSKLTYKTPTIVVLELKTEAAMLQASGSVNASRSDYDTITEQFWN